MTRWYWRSIAVLSVALAVLSGLPAVLTATPTPAARAAGGPTVVSGYVTTALTWGPADSPYVIPDGGLQIGKGGSLTILPGTIVKLDPTSGTWDDSRLSVMGGQLIARGTEADPIIFTSSRDDSAGGDTNGDGTATAPQPGDWRSIYFDAMNDSDATAMPVSVLSNVSVRYGGKGAGGSCQGVSGVTTTGRGRLWVNRSEFVHNHGAGISGGSDQFGYFRVQDSRFADGPCGIATYHGGTIDGNVFEDSLTSYGSMVVSPQQMTYTGNYSATRAAFLDAPTRDAVNVIGNSFPAGVWNQSTGVPLEYNWWGRPIGPVAGTCYSSAASPYIPAVTTIGMFDDGYDGSCGFWGSLITGYFTSVLPALDSGPGFPSAGLQSSPATPAVAMRQTWGGASGVSSRYAYRPVGLQADPVSSATGTFVHAETDAHIPGQGFDLTASRSYTSADDSVGLLGRGWSFSYDLTLTANPDGSVEFRAGDGQRVVFLGQGDGTYTGPPGVTSTLTDVTGGGWQLTTRDRTTHVFDPDGHLTQLTDPNGNSTTLTYDNGNLAEISTSTRTLVTTVAGGRLTGLTLDDGRTVTYGYTGDLLTSVTGTDGTTRSYGYDAGDRLDEITDAAGDTELTNTYGSDGRVTSQTDALGEVTTFDWDPTTQTSVMTDPRGGEWTDVYDDNVLVSRTDPVGGRYTYEYDDQLQLTVMTDARGTITMLGYDGAGNVETSSGPGGTVLTQHDAAGNVTSTTNARGTTVAFTYDAAGNLLTETRPNPAGGAALVRSREYTPAGQLAAAVDERGARIEYAYDADGDLTTVTAPTGDEHSFTHDATGRLLSATSPTTTATTATTSYTYDDADRVLSSTDALGGVTTASYDTRGRLISGQDALGQSTNYAYDDAGHLLTATGPDAVISAASPTSSATYDANGNIATATDASGRVTTYSYDAANRLTSAQTPLGTYTYDRDVAGQVTGITDPAGQRTGLRYDYAGRVARVLYPSYDMPDAKYTYDANGNRATMTDGAGTVTYTWDALDRLTAATRGSSTFSYGRDAVGNVTRQTQPDGTVTDYTYDLVGNLTTVAQTATPVAGGSSATSSLADYTYGPNGELLTAVFGDGTTSTRSYDLLGRLTSIDDQGPTGAVTSSEYALNAGGQVTSITGQDGATAPWTDSYDYDPQGRLTQVCFTSSTCPTSADPQTTPPSTDFIAWSYDPTGNRLSETRPAGTTTYGYNAAGQLTSTSGPAGSTSYTYNTAGQLTADGGHTYTYNDAGRMVSSTTAGTTSGYTYDGDGRRLTTSTGSATTTYQWDPLTYELAAERSGTATGTLTRRYTTGMGPLTLEDASGRYTQHADAVGSIVALTDSAGAIAANRRWEPFGLPRTSTSTTTAPTGGLGWTGALVEGSNLAGDVHLRARQYDPATGRFTTTDPAAAVTAGASYTYAAGDPITLTDPYGLWDWRGAVRSVTQIADTVANAAIGVAVVAGTLGIAPVAAFAGGVAVAAGAVSAAGNAALAIDSCYRSRKGSCGTDILAAAISTASILPFGRIGRAVDRLLPSGATSAADGMRLRAQLTGQELAGSHAYQKHVIERGEFPEITSRNQFAQLVEDVVANGTQRQLTNGRTAYWSNGTVVIRNPRDSDGGTAFRPTRGYSYFLGLD